MLVDAGFELPTLTAFIWVPLVFVAWGDGELDERERESILEIPPRRVFRRRKTAAMMMEHEWFAKAHVKICGEFGRISSLQRWCERNGWRSAPN